MTGAPLNPRDRHVLMVGLVSVVAIVAGGRGFPWLAEYTAKREFEAGIAASRAARADEALRHAQRTDVALQRVRADLALYDSSLVEGETPSAASARLAELVSEAASGTDARLGSITLGVDSSGKGERLSRVTARASLSGELYSIVLVLQSLEEGPHLLAVRELSVTQAQPVASQRQIEVLQADILVEGLYRYGEAGIHR